MPVGAEDLPRLAAFAAEKKIDLTVVGPDNPLALGIVDLFQRQGLRIWGVNQKAAQFESSKVFSQRFMEKYGIPTAAAGTFEQAPAAKRFCATLGGKCVVKADGLALGKGVLICGTQAEAERAVDEIMVNRAFGAAGTRVVVQEFLEGMEVSLHALCDGTTARIFPNLAGPQACFGWRPGFEHRRNGNLFAHAVSFGGGTGECGDPDSRPVYARLPGRRH